MIRLFHVYFPGRTLLLALSESLVVVLAMLVATIVVFGADASLILGYEEQLRKILLVAGVCMVCMHYYDLYSAVTLYHAAQMATRVVQVLGTACVILAIVYYVYPEAQLSGGLLLIWVFLAGTSLIVWRRLFLAINRSAHLMQKTLLLGAGALAARLADEITSRPELGLKVAGYVDQAPASGEVNHLPHLGSVDELPTVLEDRGIQRVIIAMEDRRGRLPVELLLEAKTRGVIVDDGAQLYEAIAGRVDLNSLHLSMLLFSDGFRVSTLMLLYKRMASMLLATAGLVLTLPIMALIAIAIRLDSRGPVIFRQKRLGKDGRPFTLYKFRSMRDGADAEEGRSKPAQHNDGRCTRVGRWLRAVHLDELPQLFNILRGDMHFVGPRPFEVEMEKELARKIPFYSKRWAVKPGATGWAQVRRGYNETQEDNLEKLGYDLYYIKNLSVGLDFLVCLETVKILLLGRGGR